MSIDAQVAALDAWAEGHIVVDHYVDLGISARKPISKRPELQRLLRDVEQNKLDLVAFTKLDRWTRNIREYYKAQDILESHNVAWRAIHEDYETETAAGRLKVNIMLAVAQDEADRTSERIKAVFDNKRAKGLVTTGNTAIGLRISEGHYVPGEDAERVKAVFQTFINTRSARSTAREMGMTINGMRYLIRNHNYVTAGVVTEFDFSLANDILSQRSQRHDRTDRVYIFSGLIVCPRCGGNLTAMFSNGYKYYRCHRHYDARCAGYSVSEKKVEEYLIKHLLREVSKTNVRISQKTKKPQDAKKLKAKMDKLTDLYLNDLIDRDRYEREYKSTQAALVEAEREPVKIDTSEVKTVLDAYKALSDEGKKAFWSRIIKSIKPTETGFDVTINYTYRHKSEDILSFVKMGSEEKA